MHRSRAGRSDSSQHSARNVTGTTLPRLCLRESVPPASGCATPQSSGTGTAAFLNIYSRRARNILPANSSIR